MNFNWETRDEKLLKYISIPPKRKLEWLYKMHEFTLKFASKKTKKIFWKLREKIK